MKDTSSYLIDRQNKSKLFNEKNFRLNMRFLKNDKSINTRSLKWLQVGPTSYFLIFLISQFKMKAANCHVSHRQCKNILR